MTKSKINSVQSQSSTSSNDTSTLSGSSYFETPSHHQLHHPPPPASPPATPLLCSPDPIPLSSSPSPSSSYSSMNVTTTSSSSSKSIIRPRHSKSTPLLPSENIQVMVRCRPPCADIDAQKEEDCCWVLTPEHGTIQLDDTSSTVFEYDKVFNGIHNTEIYESGIQKLVRSTMEGYNGTVLAYGQTASGKTYTMTGTSQEPGIIPKAVNDVFAYIEEEAVDREFLLQVSYMEIYNEKINDLLNSNDPPTPAGLKIRRAQGEDYVEGLTIVAVTTPEEVMKYIQFGEKKRHTSETDFNENSSRSHTIFQLVIESKPKLSSFASVRTSRLNLIDLAGSEKVATNTERRQEGSFINKSLLTLGKVITQLNEGAQHIPYRDSKLTRILSGSLSGNDRVAVICTINPTLRSKDESANTLRFAQGVKKVKINPRITQTTHRSKLQNYKEQIAELEVQMQKKTEIEAEAIERLTHLVSFILTSTKTSSNTASKLSEAVADNNFWMKGSVSDVLQECEQHLSATIHQHQDDIKRKDDDMQQLRYLLIEYQQQLEQKAATIDSLQEQLSQYDQQLKEKTTTIGNLQSQLTNGRHQMIDALQGQLTQYQQQLEEKNSVIEELEGNAMEYQRIIDEQKNQLDKNRLNSAEINKKWIDFETNVKDTKERLIISEGKVAMLEAMQKADEYAKQQLQQQLEECKAELEQRIQDDQLLAMVQSVRDDDDVDDEMRQRVNVEENNDRQLTTQLAEDDDINDVRNEQMEYHDGTGDGDSNNCNNIASEREDTVLLINMQRQLEEAEQALHDQTMELEKEKERSTIYRKKLDQVQAQLDKVETSLKDSINSMHEYQRPTSSTTLPVLSTTILPPLSSSTSSLSVQLSSGASSSLNAANVSSDPRKTIMATIFSLFPSFYLGNGSWVLLLAFAFWLFI